MRYYSESLGENITVNSVLSSNAKLLKSQDALGIHTVGLSLSPANSSGIANLCGGKSDGCENSCVLKFSGRQVMPNVIRAARNRTALFFDNRELFYQLLRMELGVQCALAHAEDKRLAFRGNTASDLPIESLCPESLAIADMNYDYTAIYSRALKSLSWAHNYHLTFSVKENTPLAKVESILSAGGNVAIVVDVRYTPSHKKFGMLPEYVVIGGREYRTVDGDVHDVRRREIDGSGVVVLLRSKGKRAARAYAKRSGFAKRLDGFAGGITSTLSIARDTVATIELP